MNAPRVLIAQHRAIEALFDELAAERGSHARARSAERLAEEIIAHVAGEEAVVSPAARQSLRGGRSAAGEARDRQLTLRLQLRRFLETPEGDAAFPARLATLREVFAEHVRNQEEDLFPRLAAALGTAELEALGAQVLAARPPVWVVLTEGQARFGAPSPRAARARMSLPSTR